ncbi:uncharacterized protein ACIB01_013404 [Guaruba guarouba]
MAATSSTFRAAVWRAGLLALELAGGSAVGSCAEEPLPIEVTTHVLSGTYSGFPQLKVWCRLGQKPCAETGRIPLRCGTVNASGCSRCRALGRRELLLAGSLCGPGSGAGRSPGGAAAGEKPAPEAAPRAWWARRFLGPAGLVGAPAAAAAPGRRSVTASGDGERRVPGAGSSASLPRGQRLPARDGAKPREAPEEAGQARLGFAGGPRRSFPVCTCGGLYVNQGSMDRYRYFIFNQRSMVVLGLFQIAFSTVCIVSGLIDGVFRTESQLSISRAPVWAGMVMGVPGLLALFSSQRKNPVLVNVLIVSSITSYVAILIVIVYSSLTLNYGEEEELSSASVHVIHTKFILNKVVKAANVAMLAASVCSAFVVLVMAYLGCRSLPRCSCYDSVTGMEWLQPSEDQSQTVEMICTAQSPEGRIFNFPDQFPAQDLDAEEDASKPPPYIRMA